MPTFDHAYGSGPVQKITRISELPNVIYDNVELGEDLIPSVRESATSQPQVEVFNGTSADFSGSYNNNQEATLKHLMMQQ